MPERPFADYLEESIVRIERDVPAMYTRMGHCIGERKLDIDVGHERVGVALVHARIVVGAPFESAHVTARTTRGVIVALADGALTLEEAVADERVALFGAVEDLLSCLDALMAYLNGAARCPELGALMESFRKDGE